eukprot:s271_g24.t1
MSDMELPGQIDETQANTDTSDGDSGRAADPQVPTIHPPSMPSTAPDKLKREGSKCSNVSPRNIHEHVDPGSKNSAHEMQRTVESLHSFRIALETNQLQCLRLFDHELEKLKRNLPADATTRMSYRDRLLKPGDRSRRSVRSKSSVHSSEAANRANRYSAASKCSREAEKSTHEGTQSLTQSLQSPIFSTTLTSSLPTSPSPPTSPPTSPATSPASPGMSLPKRQRRMSWITKQGTGFLDAKALEELKAKDASESQEEVQRKKTVRTTYSSEASNFSGKRQSKVKSEELKAGGMLTQLNPDLAKDAVMDRAAAEFGKPRLEIMKTDGRLYAIASHPFFERITLAVILLNAGWIGVDIELNKADMLFRADPIFIVMENFFCIFFLAELIIRFGLFKKTSYVIKDIWFLADFFLVSLMILETWLVPVIDAFTNGSGSGMSSGASVLRVARVMRVLRTARMARLVRLMPELMILIKGMMVAFRSVFFTLLLLLLITYVFAVAFVQFSRDTNLERGTFGTMGEAVATLILKCILTDQEDLIRSVTEESLLMSFLLLTFIFFGSLTVMNMLLGVLVEAIKTVSTIEREQLEVDFAKRADTDGDNCISEEEYMAVLQKPEAMTALTSLGVDVDAALDYGKLLFEDGEPLTFGDFMKGILTLRGSNQTTVKDIVDLRKFTADEFNHLQEVLEVVNQQLALNRPHDAGAEHSRRASFASSRGSRGDSD